MRTSDQNGSDQMRSRFVSGEWTVEPSRNLLVRGDAKVRVEPRVMDVMIYLAGRAGEVVSKEELVERVWPGRYVTDEVLTVTIYALRKALKDDARRPKYIETVSRRGYRWIVPVVRPVCAAREPMFAPIQDGEQHRLEAQNLRPIQGRRVAAMTTALALFAAAGAWIFKPFSHRRHVASAEAWEAYVKGRFFLDQRSIRGWRQALDQFERGVALDPQDPAAEAGLADTYSAMSDFGVASAAEMRPQAIEAAQRALDLDPNSAEGYEALGRAQFLFEWNYAAAERNLERAVLLDPDYMPAHQAMAWVKSARGQYSEAVSSARRALQLDPVNTARYTELAWVLALSGRYDEALGQVNRALVLNPQAFETYLMKGWTYELAGQPNAAFAAYRDALRLAGAPEERVKRAEAVYRAEGLTGYYRDLLNVTARSGQTPMSDTWRAQFYVRAGQPDRAIASLEQAYQKREGALAWVNVEPSFQQLRANPRFQQIAARVGAN
jgi:DNA-binding winged helix-turn-helix (wHTH) protein/cytochrome c-type biogenesis protein CcmH/NrfG